MDVKTKTIQLAKVYEAIANARSILEELEEKATRLASNEDVQMGEVVLGAVKKETFRSGESETRTSKLKRIRTC